ncbi:phytoene/squalene synthase family protein [Corynebacterium choanae]|uniref:15-cis-phytoene synthase n=1 Tax=Corynebacterium choanae TaxID=1862358 RepID=A0A3G6JAW4_9CORY|nr:phytoene/squalene synthase family protein [Corynebacterium choanae]AZA14078.1 15-cis-phytoene synthase [Corynebacterium choanae]
MATHTTSLEDYQAMSAAAASGVIGRYSTSFSFATRLLPQPLRTDIRNLYSVVRIADEIVDGTAAAAGLSQEQIAARLEEFERDTYAAMESGFSTNPMLQAFADTARQCHIPREHMTAFYASMRADITAREFSKQELAAYIYGSAEVIGLMCVAIFLRNHVVSPQERSILDAGAQALGAAFQKINFLRDYAEDTSLLGRSYFAAWGKRLDEQQKQLLVEDIRQDLHTAYATIPLLPFSSRSAVLAAYYFFATLTDKVDQTSVAVLEQQRVRVSNPEKMRLIAQAVRQAAVMGKK